MTAATGLVVWRIVLVRASWTIRLRISEALALQEIDLDRSRGAVLVRRGKGGKRREVGMDRWAWEQLDRWLEIRQQLPIGSLLCVIHGPTADSSEIISTVHGRPSPTISASAGLQIRQ